MTAPAPTHILYDFTSYMRSDFTNYMTGGQKYSLRIKMSVPNSIYWYVVFYSYFSLLAQLSRRPIGELIGWVGTGCSSVINNNININNPGHMTKMSTMPIYGEKNFKIFFSGTGGLISMKLGMKH